MRIITTRQDIEQYANEVGPQGTADADIRERFAAMVWEARKHGDTPPLGEDWSEWLEGDTCNELFAEAHKADHE